MHIRDRVKELRRVKASQLRPHPKNWRIHPQEQQDALRGVLAEVGFAGALLARELPDGSLELIDGHLRAETAPEMEVPVLVLDLNEQEAAKLLALHDPLTALAEVDGDALTDLLSHVETQNEAVQKLLHRMVGDSDAPLVAEPEDGPPAVLPIPESYQVVVECRDEPHQRELYEHFTAEGLPCKLLML
jgi:hypothetical protein